jgi:hypothetical protein
VESGRRTSGANYPTLTSNRATLGWGTLVAPAGIKVAAHSMCLPGAPSLPQLRVGRARQGEDQRLAACGTQKGSGNLDRAGWRASLGPPLQKAQGWATLGSLWFTQNITSRREKVRHPPHCRIPDLHAVHFGRLRSSRLRCRREGFGRASQTRPRS